MKPIVTDLEKAELRFQAAKLVIERDSERGGWLKIDEIIEASKKLSAFILDETNTENAAD